jgi:hypothetical protein
MNKKIIFFSFLFLCFIANAQIGVGNTNPAVNLDARAATGNSAIAFGDTNQTAAGAGAGAMKYDNTAKQMYYSDGTNWVSVAATQITAFIPKVVASGRTTVGQTNTGSTPSVPTPPFLKFVFGDIRTNDGNWNTSTNTYTVANSGIYQMSLAGNITSNQASSATSWWIVVNGNRYNVYNLANSTNYFGGGSISLYLLAGTTILFGSSSCQGCGGTDTYTIQPGNTFTITQLGSGT